MAVTVLFTSLNRKQSFVMGGGSLIGQICVTSFKNIPIGLLPFLLFSYVLGDNKDTFSFPLPGSVFRGRNWTFESGDAK